MTRKYLKIYMGVLVIVSGASFCSCKYKDGANQPPVNKTVTVYQPCHYINTVPNGTKNVNFKTEIYVKTQGSNGIQNYPGTPIVSIRTCSGQGGDTYIPYGKEYTVPEPASPSYYGTDVFVETMECGWPVANYSATIGGLIKYEAISTILPQPQNISLFPTDFSTVYTTQCQ